MRVKASELYHYGVKGMKWGVRRTPEQLGHKVIKKKTTSKDMDTMSYSIKDKNGSVMSKMNVYDFKMKGFDWALLADLDTEERYRGRGLATRLINDAYKDVTRDLNKGLYLSVKIDNFNAIKLYQKLDFKSVKKYSSSNGNYLIMAKGDQDFEQLKNMNFK